MKRLIAPLILLAGAMSAGSSARAADETAPGSLKSLPIASAEYVEGSLISTCRPSDAREPNCGRKPFEKDPIIRPFQPIPEDYNARGIAFLEQGLIDNAISDFDKAVALRPDYAEAFNNRGNAKYVAGRYEEAIADFDEALHLNPKLTAVLSNRGQAYNTLQRYASAVADLDIYLREKPHDRDALLNRAFALRQLKAYGRAIDDLTAALRLGPRDPIALNARCWTRAIAALELREALVDCDESLRLRPGNCQTLDSRALVEFRMGRYVKSIRDNNAALKINPSQASSFFIRGAARMQLGETKAGAADIATALAMDPTIRDTYAQYGVMP